MNLKNRSFAILKFFKSFKQIPFAFITVSTNIYKFKKQLLDFYITSNFGSFFPRINQYTKSKIFKYTLSSFGFFSLYDALQFKDDINYFDIFDSSFIPLFISSYGTIYTLDELDQIINFQENSFTMLTNSFYNTTSKRIEWLFLLPKLMSFLKKNAND